MSGIPKEWVYVKILRLSHTSTGVGGDVHRWTWQWEHVLFPQYDEWNLLPKREDWRWHWRVSGREQTIRHLVRKVEVYVDWQSDRSTAAVILSVEIIGLTWNHKADSSFLQPHSDLRVLVQSSMKAFISFHLTRSGERG